MLNPKSPIAKIIGSRGTVDCFYLADSFSSRKYEAEEILYLKSSTSIICIKFLGPKLMGGPGRSPISPLLRDGPAYPSTFQILPESGCFIVGQILLKASTCKVTKHDRTYTKNQYMFMSFVFDIFRFGCVRCLEFLNRIQ
ncbi:hypothetical protein LXL04_010944 [Taraxacum kok-saghyz]